MMEPDEFDKSMRVARLSRHMACEQETNSHDDVLRALVAHPAAIRPLYRLIVGDDSGIGRMAAASEIARRAARKERG